MWWTTTTPPRGASPSGLARYASSSAFPWPVMVAVPAPIASLMAVSAPCIGGWARTPCRHGRADLDSLPHARRGSGVQGSRSQQGEQEQADGDPVDHEGREGVPGDELEQPGDGRVRDDE